MCTVSWLHEDGSYQLLCNRDEKKDRLRARSPRITSRTGVRFIAPCDPVANGTWIAVNEFGLSLCLLNAPGPVKPRSRGHVVLQLISAACVSEVKMRLAAVDLSSTSPFTLAMVVPSDGTATAEWNGTSLVFPPSAQMPLTSSSFDPKGVYAARLNDFEHRVQTAKRLDSSVLCAFHEDHGSAPSAYSTCMHRADAGTVSFSWIEVGETAIDFFYKPAAPCRSQPGETYRLPRRR